MTRGTAVRQPALAAAVLAYLAVGAAAAAHGDGWLLLAWVGYPVVGALVLRLRPGNAIGRLMLLVGILWTVAGSLSLPAVVDAAPAAVELVAGTAAFLVWLVLPGVVLLFPSGRVETRLGRVTARLLVATAAAVAVTSLLAPRPLVVSGRENPFGWDALAPVSQVVLEDGGFVVVPLLLLAALVDLTARWRRSSGVRRLQYRWFFFGVTVMLVVVGSSVFETFFWDSETDPGGSPLGAVLFNALPVSIGIAVTRHGLYEIDRVVSRTVAYAVVTATVLATYAAVVTSLTRLLPVSSTLAVAAATLAAATVARPVLRRVQERVDRRFNRARYDARATVDAFGARLRDDVDPRAAADDLVDVVGRTLEPSSVGLWVRRTP